MVCYLNLLPFEPTEQNINTFIDALEEAEIERLKKSIPVMKAHCNDPMRSLVQELAKMHAYMEKLHPEQLLPGAPPEPA